MKKGVSQTNKKTSRNQSLQQRYHQWNQHEDCHPCKILGTLLEMDEGRNSSNKPKGKKANEDAHMREITLTYYRCQVKKEEEDSQH